MIIGVDIGGTKTLLAMFAENGKMLKEVRFETNQIYEEFLLDLEKHARSFETSKAKIACAAVPGLIDRSQGVVHSLGNLPWQEKPIRADIARALCLPNVYIENDSKLAGISEARYVAESYRRVFYLTVSTGIGGAFLVDGNLVEELVDMEIGKSPFEHQGTIMAWEDFASGRAFAEKYGKKAIDVESKAVWKEFANSLSLGLGVICANFQVDTIIFGGGLGQHLSRFKEYLIPYLQKHLHPNVKQPQELLSTHYRGQSVIYGCYEYAKDKLA